MNPRCRFFLTFISSVIFISCNGYVSFDSTRLRNYNKRFTATEGLIEISKDGGVKKIVLVPGQGRKVETGDILAVEFSASLADGGKLFAKGDKEQFILKDGSLIKGWDIGVASMQVGEKAKFRINSKYAYGDNGVSPVIPPGADIELVVKIQAWLGNQLRPETLFQKDLDIDPFISNTPEAIQADFDNRQVND